MTNPIESAIQARNSAQEHLDAILASGDDPSAARAELERAEATITELEAAQAEAAAAEQLAVEAEADALVEAVRAECAELVEGIFSGIKPTAPISVDRSTLLVRVAAQRRHSQAASDLQAADERLAALKSRMGDLDAERQAVIGRRSRGDCRPDDKADILLIEADREGVTAAIDRAQVERDRCAGIARQAREELSQTERQIEANRETAIQQTLRAAQEPIEQALVEIAAAFNAHRQITATRWWLTNTSLKNLARS